MCYEIHMCDTESYKESLSVSLTLLGHPPSAAGQERQGVRPSVRGTQHALRGLARDESRVAGHVHIGQVAPAGCHRSRCR